MKDNEEKPNANHTSQENDCKQESDIKQQTRKEYQRKYYQNNKDRLDDNWRKRRHENKEENNSKRRKRRHENKEGENSKQRKRRHENKEGENSKRRKHWHENREEENKTQQKYRAKKKQETIVNYPNEREAEFNTKSNFKTLVTEIPCDTTEYEKSPHPETGIINWYQCAGKWRLQWLMEDIQKLIDDDKLTEANEKIEILKQRISEETVTPNRQKAAADSFFRALGRGCPWGSKSQYDEHSIDARLLGCACCGIKEYNDIDQFDIKRPFEFFPFDDTLDILKLNEDESRAYKEQLECKLRLPINEEGDLDIFTPWQVKSIYTLRRSNEEGHVFYYHLHPELVITNDEDKPLAVICADCACSIKCKKIPPSSIGNNVDFGLASRIGLEPLAIRELHIVAYVRYYYNIIKIESNSRRLREHQQSAIKGSSILFEHDAPQVVSDLLSPETMNSSLCLHFVGYKGEFDSLYKKTMQSKSADVFGRSWVIYQWLSVLHEINPFYHHLKVPKFHDFKDSLNVATNTYLSESLRTFDNDIMDKTNQAKDDVAGIRATTNPNMQVSHESAEDYDDNSQGQFPIKYCYLTSTNTTAHKSSTDSTQMYFTNMAKALHVNVDPEAELYDKAKSFRSQHPINEFTDDDYGLVAAFPNVFMFGKAYGKKVCNIREKDCIHLLLQFSAVAACCRTLLFYLFDVKRRHQNIRGMSSRRKADPEAFNALSSEVTSAAFHAKLQNAVADPESKDAKYILNKFLPILTLAGKRTSFGALERNASIGELYALIRRFGHEYALITIAIDDVSNPHVFRLTFNQPNNCTFPSIAPEQFLTAMASGKPFAYGNVKIPTNWSALATAVTNNPVASAFIYKRLIYNIVTILIKLKPARLSDARSTAKVSPRFTANSLHDEGGIIAGHVNAYHGCHEASGRGALHVHLLIWAAISADLLQGVVDIKDVCTTVSEALDSMFSATLPREYHVKDLIEKELPFYPTKTNAYQRLIRRGRTMLIPPDPTLKDEFDDFVHTSICSFGIHTHDKYITGRCHKPPIGITRCALTKPSGLIEQTTPVQLIDETPLPTHPSEKITITYTVNDRFQNRNDAINQLSPSQRVGPMFRENDPRLIVWEPKRPMLLPLPKQAQDSTKEWIIFQLTNAMISHENQFKPQEENNTPHLNATSSPHRSHPKKTEDSTKNFTTINENETFHQACTPTTCQQRSHYNVTETQVCWKWPMPDILPTSYCRHGNPIGDGSCLYTSLLWCMSESHTYSDSATLRKEINAFLRSHRDLQIIPSRTVGEWAYDNLRDAHKTIDSRNDPLLQYTELMEDATPFRCQYASFLEAAVFAFMRNINVAVYGHCDNFQHRMISAKVMDEDAKTICIFYSAMHYQSLFPILNPQIITPCIPPIQIVKVKTQSEHIVQHTPHPLDSSINEENTNQMPSQGLRANLKTHTATENETETENSIPLSFMNSIEREKITHHLSGMNVDDLRALYDTIYLKLAKRNGWVVDYNPTLTAVLGCHSNTLLLGSSEQCKVASHYIGPYVNKNKFELAESLDVIYQAMEHAKKFPSIAEDSGTNARFTQYVMTRTLNQLGSLKEVSDTQAAGSLIGLYVTVSSENYTVCDIIACIIYIKNEQKLSSLHLTNDSNCNADEDSDFDSNTDCDSESSATDLQDTEEDGESMGSFIVDDESVGKDTSNSTGILQVLLDNDDIQKECDSNIMLRRIKTTIERADHTLKLPETKFFISAYGTCPLYQVDDGSRIVAVPYPKLYRYRGKGLKNLNRLEYYSTISIVKDRPDDNDRVPPHLQYKRGRKKSKWYLFDKGIEIFANHHQVMRSRQCTPKFFQNTPPHPGQKPEGTDENKQAIKRWCKRAKKFAEFYLVTFRPETELYSIDQTNTYSYEWEDLEQFVEELHRTIDLAISRFRLDYMTSMLHNLKTSRRNRAILSDFRARDTTRWSEEEQYKNQQEYKYRTRKDTAFDNSDIDEELDNQMRIGLNDRKQSEIMQKAAFTDGLLNQFRNFTRHDNIGQQPIDQRKENDCNISDEEEVVYPVRTTKYDEKLSHDILQKCFDEEDDPSPDTDDDEHDNSGNQHDHNCNVSGESLEEKVRRLIASKHLSQDKLCVIETMYQHFQNVRSGTAKEKSYTAPILLITGPPGSGKSLLIRSISDLATLLELDTPVNTTFMGIAAININGYTMNSFLDVPLEMNEKGLNSKQFRPWNTEKLEAFKKKFNVNNLSAIIIDEISMVKPWMLAYLDERLKEATQNYDKPFGGIAVLMFGDFDQQPPIGGSSLPHLAMTLLEKEYQRKNKIFFTSNQSRRKTVEINSVISRKGVRIFEQAGHLKLTTQHRCAKDPEHMENLTKMSSGFKITPSDFDLYKTFSRSDMQNLTEFLNSTIIVTGNYERQEFNTYVAGIWARHFKTHIIRWKRQIKHNKWKGRPATEEAIRHAEQQNSFYEYFVPMGPGYLSHNLNLDCDLANGTILREHSLAFDSPEENAFLDEMKTLTPVAGTITLPGPPKAINIELYPDFDDDDQETLDRNISKRKSWKHGSLTDDGKIVIPINRKTVKYYTECIRACGTPFHYNASTIPMADHFPIELGFCITIPKAQGRTIHKLIASLSEHPCNFLKFRYEQTYTLLSRITGRDDLRLLLQMGNRNTLAYLSQLEKDPYTAHYFAGFPRESNTEVVYWDPTLAARDAGFLE